MRVGKIEKLISGGGVYLAPESKEFVGKFAKISESFGIEPKIILIEELCIACKNNFSDFAVFQFNNDCKLSCLKKYKARRHSKISSNNNNRRKKIHLTWTHMSVTFWDDVNPSTRTWISSKERRGIVTISVSMPVPIAA